MNKIKWFNIMFKVMGKPVVQAPPLAMGKKKKKKNSRPKITQRI